MPRLSRKRNVKRSFKKRKSVRGRKLNKKQLGGWCSPNDAKRMKEFDKVNKAWGVRANEYKKLLHKANKQNGRLFEELNSCRQERTALEHAWIMRERGLEAEAPPIYSVGSVVTQANTEGSPQLPIEQTSTTNPGEQ
jgi:hypothetical protein